MRSWTGESKVTKINQIDLTKIAELELQIKEIDLALEVATQLIRNNPVALEKIKQVARRQIWGLQAKIDKIVYADPQIKEEEEDL